MRADGSDNPTQLISTEYGRIIYLGFRSHTYQEWEKVWIPPFNDWACDAQLLQALKGLAQIREVGQSPSFSVKDISWWKHRG